MLTVARGGRLSQERCIRRDSAIACGGYGERMCDSDAGSASMQLSSPRPAAGAAVDPITLKQVDEVTVTTLVDEAEAINEAVEAILAPFVVREPGDRPQGARGVRVLRYLLPEAEDDPTEPA